MGPDDDKTRTCVPLTAGMMVLHYRIIARIGAGGMGEIYLAEDTKLDRKVALKFLPPHLCQAAECRARFTREAKAAAKLNHPNIVTIYEVSEFNGRPFFAMELVEGQTLKEVIAGKTLPLERIVDIGIQICDGLQAAHEKGITHRDIKPSNILFDSKDRARIVDFGLASVVGLDHLTKTGSTLGTVGYMSPEQVRGEKVDHRTDLFSFGVVLYELISGQSPFKADTEAATLHAITSTRPEPLARYRREVLSGLQTIIDKTLEKDVATRYQHADELAADLKRLITRAISIPKQHKRMRRMAVSAMALLVVIVLAYALKPWKFVIKPSGEMSERKSIAIVPFKNQTDDPSLDPLGRMIADWTTQGLLESGLAEVIPPERLYQLERINNLESIAKSIRVKTMVMGSYYKFGDSIQLQAQIIDADGFLLQAIDPITIPTAKIMEGVESVRQHILGALAFVLDTRLQKPFMRVSKPPLYVAYQEYIQGLDLFTVKEDYTAAIEHLDRASALDTSFVLPPIVACAAYVNLLQWPQADSLIKVLNRSRTRLNHIQQLAVDELEGVVAHDWFKVREVSREEVKLVPESKTNYLIWAMAALSMNRPGECIAALSAGCARDTSICQADYYWDLLTYAHHVLGQHEVELDLAEEYRKQNLAKYIALKCEIRALAGLGQVEKVKEVVEEGFTYPNQPGIPVGPMIAAGLELRAHGYEAEAMRVLDMLVRWYREKPEEEKRPELWHYGYALYAARRWSEARDVFAELVRLRPDVIEFQYYRARIAARLGNRQEAIRISDSLENVQQPYLFGGPTYCRAGVAAILGVKDQAVSLLKNSFLKGHDNDLHLDFDFESLHDYPPLLELTKPKG